MAKKTKKKRKNNLKKNSKKDVSSELPTVSGDSTTRKSSTVKENSKKNVSFELSEVSDVSSTRKSPLDAEVLVKFEEYLSQNICMSSVAKECGLLPSQFRARFRAAYKAGAIVIKLPRNLEIAQIMSKHWPEVAYYVLDADGDQFFRGAAEVFFEVMDELLHVHPANQPLCIGVVSGRTSGGMIEAICNTGRSWGDYIKLNLFPSKIFVYALNVSQIDGYNHLKGNANVLAYQLAHTLTLELKESKVEAYGLSATLLQTKKEAQRTDCSAETRVVLEHTDPNRLAESWDELGKPMNELKLPDGSELDLVITGVGSIQDSLFKKYAEAHPFDINRLQEEERVVGDIVMLQSELDIS